MGALKFILGIIAAVILFFVFIAPAPGDDRVWRAIYALIAFVSLGLIWLSQKDPRYDMYLLWFLGGLLAAYLVLSLAKSAGLY